MDRQDPPNRPCYQLTRGLIGLDNEKDAVTSFCLDRKYARGDTWRMYTLWPVLPVFYTEWLFLSFGGSGRADR